VRGEEHVQSNLRYGEATTNLLRELVSNLLVARNRFNLSGARITPK
jgi:hypothetical protein